MIEILKEGKIKHQCTCKHCGCVFTFDAEDVTRRTVWDDHGAHYPVADFYELKCPFCYNTTVDVGNDFTSKEIKQMKHVDD